MQENVGGADRALRSIAGPALVALGLTRLGARDGQAVGILAVVLGALTTETVVTRVCPFNAALGLDTRRPAGGAGTARAAPDALT
jgi:uncharacterized membrane protein